MSTNRSLPAELLRRVLTYAQPLEGAVRAGVTSREWAIALATPSLWQEWYWQWWRALRPVEDEDTWSSSSCSDDDDEEEEEAVVEKDETAASVGVTDWRALFIKMAGEEDRAYSHLRQQFSAALATRVVRWRLRVKILRPPIAVVAPSEETTATRARAARDTERDAGAYAWREHELVAPHHVAVCPQSVTLCSANAALQELIFDSSGGVDGEGDAIAVEIWGDVSHAAATRTTAPTQEELLQSVCIFRCPRYVLRDPQIVGAGHQRNILQAHICSMFVWVDRTNEFRKQRWATRGPRDASGTQYRVLQHDDPHTDSGTVTKEAHWAPVSDETNGEPWRLSTSTDPYKDDTFSPVILQVNVTASTFLRALCGAGGADGMRAETRLLIPPAIAATGLMRRLFSNGVRPLPRLDEAEAAAAAAAACGATGDAAVVEKTKRKTAGRKLMKLNRREKMRARLALDYDVPDDAVDDLERSANALRELFLPGIEAESFYPDADGIAAATAAAKTASASTTAGGDIGSTDVDGTDHALLSLSLSFVTLTGMEVGSLQGIAVGVPTLTSALKPTPVALDEGRHACFSGDSGEAAVPLPLDQVGRCDGVRTRARSMAQTRAQHRLRIELQLWGWTGIPDVARGMPCVADFTLFKGDTVVCADCGLEVWRDDSRVRL